MSNISKEEYLKLIEPFLEDLENNYDPDHIPEESWISAECEVKEKIKISKNSAIIDVTNFKRNKIEETIYKNINIRVGKFLIKIHSYNGYLADNKLKSNLSMHISIWETKNKTMSGFPCNMENPLLFFKDSRFIGSPWLKYFGQTYAAISIPSDIVVDIIKWLQIVTKNPTFA